MTDDNIMVGVLIFLFLFFVFLCFPTNDGLYTGCKGGMHSDNDGCAEKTNGKGHINYCK